MMANDDSDGCNCGCDGSSANDNSASDSGIGDSGTDGSEYGNTGGNEDGDKAGDKEDDNAEFYAGETIVKAGAAEGENDRKTQCFNMVS